MLLRSNEGQFRKYYLIAREEFSSPGGEKVYSWRSLRRMVKIFCLDGSIFMDLFCPPVYIVSCIACVVIEYYKFKRIVYFISIRYKNIAFSFLINFVILLTYDNYSCLFIYERAMKRLSDLFIACIIYIMFVKIKITQDFMIQPFVFVQKSHKHKNIFFRSLHDWKKKQLS